MPNKTLSPTPSQPSGLADARVEASTGTPWIEARLGVYSARTAARIARIPTQRFQAWQKAHLLRPSRFTHGNRVENIYTYDDLLLIRLIVRMKEHGVKPKSIRVALDTIEHMGNGDKTAWKRVKIYVCDGLIVVVDPENKEWNPIAASEGPQRMALIFFPQLVEELRRELVPTRFKHIDVDPEVLGGSPTVKGTRISTSVIVSVLNSGGNPREAYPDLTDEQVKEVEDYELSFLQAA